MTLVKHGGNSLRSFAYQGRRQVGDQAGPDHPEIASGDPERPR